MCVVADAYDALKSGRDWFKVVEYHDIIVTRNGSKYVVYLVFFPDHNRNY